MAARCESHVRFSCGVFAMVILVAVLRVCPVAAQVCFSLMFLEWIWVVWKRILSIRVGIYVYIWRNFADIWDGKRRWHIAPLVEQLGKVAMAQGKGTEFRLDLQPCLHWLWIQDCSLSWILAYVLVFVHAWIFQINQSNLCDRYLPFSFLGIEWIIRIAARLCNISRAL